MVDVTVEARNDADNPGLVKLQGATWELTAVIPALLQVLYLAGFDQGGGKAADVGLDLRGDGVAEQRERKRIAALGRMSKLNETVHPAPFGLNS